MIKMKDLKLNLELELGLEVNLLLNEDSGEEDDFYLNINEEIDIFEGAYQKWDIYIEEGDIEKSFMSNEELIMFLKDYIKE
jgi:hypothetical protein